MEGDRNPPGDLVLQREQIARIALEPLGPDMRVGRGVDQLGRDSNPLARALNAAFEHIAHAELSPDLLRADPLSLIGKGRIARDHKTCSNPRQIGGQVFGDRVGEIFLSPIVAAIGKGEHDDRQARGGAGAGASDRLAPDRRLGLGPRYRADKAIAAAGNRLDAAAVQPASIEDPA